MCEVAYMENKTEVLNTFFLACIRQAVSTFFLEPHLQQTRADLVNARSGRVQQTGRQHF